MVNMLTYDGLTCGIKTERGGHKEMRLLDISKVICYALFCQPIKRESRKSRLKMEATVRN